MTVAVYRLILPITAPVPARPAGPAVYATFPAAGGDAVHCARAATAEPCTVHVHQTVMAGRRAVGGAGGTGGGGGAECHKTGLRGAAEPRSRGFD